MEIFNLNITRQKHMQIHIGIIVYQIRDILGGVQCGEISVSSDINQNIILTITILLEPNFKKYGSRNTDIYRSTILNR